MAFTTTRSPGLESTTEGTKTGYTGLSDTEYQAMTDRGFIDNFTTRAFQNYITQRNAWKPDAKNYPIGGAPPNPFGKGGWGVFNDYAQSAVTDKGYREQFNKKPGETLADWKARLTLEFPGFDLAFDSSDLATDTEANKYFAFTENKGVGGKTPEQIAAEKVLEEEEKTRGEIRAFSDSLKTPLSADDPQVKHILNITSQGVSDQARLRGIEGPMAIGAMQQSTNNQLLDYNKDRESRYFTALQYKDASQLREGQARDAERYGQWAAEAGAAQQRAANSPLPMILGGAGAAVGAVGGFFAGGPAGAGAGAFGGWNLGRGMGTSASQPYIPPPPAPHYGSGGGR